MSRLRAVILSITKIILIKFYEVVNMENLQYSIGNKYIIISQNVIQSRKYLVNKITIGDCKADTDKSLIFETIHGRKRISKRTISKLINITNIASCNEMFLIERIEGALK